MSNMSIHPFAANPPMRRGRRDAAVCVVAACFFLAGWNDDAPAADGARPMDACTLLTEQDVATVFGMPVGEPQANTRGNDGFWTSMCNYAADSADGVPGAGILLKPHYVAAGPEQAYAEHQSELVAQLGADAAQTPIHDIGAPAGWEAPNRAVGQLTVFQGPYMFIVSVGTAPGADQLTPAKELALRVLQRLR
jgi:hypothetical protein